MDDAYIKIAQITSLHGVTGGVKAFMLTDVPTRFKKVKECYLNNNGNRVKCNLLSSTVKGSMVFLSIEGITTSAAANAIIGAYIEIPENEKAMLPKNSYYHFQLVGCKVYDQNDNFIGEITEVIPHPANDLFVLDGNITRLIPAVKAFVKEIDIENKKISINNVPGLLE